MHWHPMTVHFPIALSIVAMGMYVYSLIQSDESTWRIGYLLHGFATLGAILAVLTGRSAGGESILTSDIDPIFQNHQILGYVILWLMAMLLLWQYLRIHKMQFKEKIALVCAYLIVLCTISYGSWLGGRMVYEKGIGVEPMQPQLQEQLDREQRSNPSETH